MSTAAPSPALFAGLPTGWTVQNALSSNNGGGDQSLVNGGSAPVSGIGGSGGPSKNGLTAWSFDPFLGTQTAAMTTGQQYSSKFWWPGGSMNYLYVYVTSAATTTTHGWLAVYDGSGTQWAATADQGSAAFTATGQVKLAVAGAPVPVPSGWYYSYMAAVFSAGTLKVLGLTALTSTTGPYYEEGIAAAPYVFTSDATTVSALPASLAWGTGWAADTSIGMWSGVS